MPKAKKSGNPFIIGGLVTGEAFTDRAAELRRIQTTLTEPQAKLLVYGPRRMGKTSTLDRAIGLATKQGRLATRADLSGSTTLSDISTRIMQATAGVIGRRWKDGIESFIKNLDFTFTLTPDPATGFMIPGVSVQQRTEKIESQRATLESVLRAADQFAASKRTTLGLVLDEFQTIHKFGGEEAEWHLRGLMQGHQHLAYVAAGSDVGLITAMVGKARAFYKLFDLMSFGAIDPVHMARWIDERMEGHGIIAEKCGELIVRAAGPRTRDIVQLARATFTEAQSAGRVSKEIMQNAFQGIVSEEADVLRMLWDGFATAQQNVLRAIAADTERLYTADTMKQFGLKSTAEVRQAVRYLNNDHIISQVGTDYVLDSPYFRGWIRQNMLADVGVRRPLF